MTQMLARGETRMPITVRNIAIGAACIIAANLISVALRQVVTLPLPNGIVSAIATGIGVFVWFLIVGRMKA